MERKTTSVEQRISREGREGAKGAKFKRLPEGPFIKHRLDEFLPRILGGATRKFAQSPSRSSLLRELRVNSSKKPLSYTPRLMPCATHDARSRPSPDHQDFGGAT